MPGVMPPTALLLVRSGVVQGHFSSYTAIGYYLGIYIDDDGVITFMKEKRHPTYVLDTHGRADPGFSKENAIRDWCRCSMQKNLPRDYEIYRYLK